MPTRKRRTSAPPPLPRSKFDREKVTEMFRDMRIAQETGVPPDPGKWRSIRDLLTEEALRTWSSDDDEVS